MSFQYSERYEKDRRIDDSIGDRNMRIESGLGNRRGRVFPEQRRYGLYFFAGFVDRDRDSRGNSVDHNIQEAEKIKPEPDINLNL